MTRDSLKEFLRTIYSYHGKAPASESQLDAWYYDLRKIPAECLPWMMDRLKETEYFPRNIPVAMRSLWNEWLHIHPDKQAVKQKAGCVNCHNGWIFVSYWNDKVGYWGETALKCGHCNSKGDPACVSAWTVDRIIMANKFYRSQLGGNHDYASYLKEAPRDDS